MQNKATHKYGFPKHHRLTHKRDIDRLYNNACFAKVFPLKLMVRVLDDSEQNDNSASVVLSVPKRLHKNAVTRNLIRRRIKEVYRKNNAQLFSLLKRENKSCHLMVLYIGKHIASYSEIESSWAELMPEIEKIIVK